MNKKFKEGDKIIFIKDHCDYYKKDDIAILIKIGRDLGIPNLDDRFPGGILYLKYLINHVDIYNDVDISTDLHRLKYELKNELYSCMCINVINNSPFLKTKPNLDMMYTSYRLLFNTINKKLDLFSEDDLKREELNMLKYQNEITD